MDRGFTIIETTLFVAISGLLAMMVLVGFNSSIDANRRVDTNRSFEAAIEAEYTSVRTSTVIREVDTSGKVPTCKLTGPPTPTYPGSSDDCLVIGKVLKIKQGANSSVTSYNVVANVTPTPSCDLTLTGISAIIDRDCYGARVIDMAKPTGVIYPEWQAEISRVDFQSKANPTTFRSRTSSQVAYLAILRAPSSELVYIAMLNENNDLNNNRFILGQPPVDNQLSNYENAKGQICIKHQGLLASKGYLRFNGGSSLGSIDVFPDPLFSGVTC